MLNLSNIHENSPGSVQAFAGKGQIKEFSNDLLKKKPIIYLDFDGVINFFNSRSNYIKNKDTFGYLRRATVTVPGARGGEDTSYELNWAAELLRALSLLDVDIIWLTTWREHTPILERFMQWDKPVGYNHWGGGGAWGDSQLSGDSSKKLEAIIEHQTFFPSPFIWLDDEAPKHYYANEFMANILKNTAPHLIIMPEEKYGIVKPEFAAIVDFLDSLKSANEV